jgi:hypothetical protein
MRKTLIVLAVILVQGASGHLFAQGDFGFEIAGFGGRSLWQDRNFQIGPPQVPVGSSNINLNLALFTVGASTYCRADIGAESFLTAIKITRWL